MLSTAWRLAAREGHVLVITSSRMVNALQNMPRQTTDSRHRIPMTGHDRKIGRLIIIAMIREMIFHLHGPAVSHADSDMNGPRAVSRCSITFSLHFKTYAFRAAAARRPRLSRAIVFMIIEDDITGTPLCLTADDEAGTFI